MGVPDPQGAADTIRDVFGRMDMDDRENVALIGGGHTFGKCHGASTDDPGPKPFENEANPWPGNFGSGRGMDTVTSGFEGAWTDNPIQWDNSYFTNLLNYEWESWKGPGGHYQWRVKGQGPKGPVAYPPNSKDKQDIMMLTTDIGLITDPEYRKYVEEFANDPSAFAEAFAAVWYKLVNRDMGPATRCVGPDVAPPQAFQFPLPDPPAKLADFDAVEKDLGKLKDGEFIRLAMQSANTYRCTDYLGGCNGARIRFSPGKDWKTNVGLDKTLAVLEPIKKQYGDSLSWADLIVLAGNVAVKHMGAPSNIPFCPGRTDAPDGAGWKPLEFGNAEFPSSVADMVERYERRGLTAKEFVALSFANSLAPVAWLQEILSSEGVHDDVMAEGFKFHPDLRIWAEYYLATGHEVFANDFATVWTKLMNSDRFDGPTGNVCIVSP
jgi:catalase-peroxidase